VCATVAGSLVVSMSKHAILTLETVLKCYFWS